MVLLVCVQAVQSLGEGWIITLFSSRCERTIEECLRFLCSPCLGQQGDRRRR
jgi:hypothetical protein